MATADAIAWNGNGPKRAWMPGLPPKQFEYQMKRRKAILTLAIVCSHDRCRGALALCAMRKDWSDRGFQAFSVGLEAQDGMPAHDMARTAALQAGLHTIEAHRSHRLSDSMLRQADLVLVMDAFQQQEVLRRQPKCFGSVYRLGRWRDANIPDPVFSASVSASACLTLIRACLQDWARCLEASGLLPPLYLTGDGVPGGSSPAGIY